MSGLELEETAQENKPSEESTKPKSTGAPANPNQKNMFLYDGRAGQIYKIWLLNFFMTIITIGIYKFWGKTRLRKYIAGGFILDGDRFEYTGTGKELFKGFAKAIPVLMMTYTPFLIASFFGGEEALWPIIFLAPIFFIFGVAKFTSLRYRLSRTQWRGIRGFLDGSALKYGIFSIQRMCLNIVSLSFTVPYSDIAKHRYIVTGLYFGNVPLEFEANPKALVKIHWITMFLAIPTLGFSRLWYRAAVTRMKINGLTVGKMSFTSTVTGASLLKHIIANILIIVLTLGLGAPIAIQRNMKYFARNTKIIGDLNTAEIMQAENQTITVGEGLDDIFDMDTGFM